MKSIPLSIRNSIFFSSHTNKHEPIPFARKKDALMPGISPGGKFKDEEPLKKFNDIITQYAGTGSLVGIILHDENGKQVAANPIAEKLYSDAGTPIEIKTINHLWETGAVIANDDEKVTLDSAPFIKALRTGKPQKGSFIICRRNGKQRRLFFRSQPFYEKGESANCVVTSIIDITHERKKTGPRQEIKEELTQSFMTATPEPAWVVDEDGALLFASDAFFMYFGLNEENSIGKTLFDLLPLPICEALYTKHLKGLSAGKNIRSIEDLQFADGTHVMFCINLFTTTGPGQKKVIAGYAIYLDNKMCAEAKLRDTEEKLFMLNHAASDATWEWDMKTGRIYRNMALMNIIGYKTNHFTWLSWWLRHIHPDDLGHIKDKVKETAGKHLPSWQEQYRIRCVDGNYKYVQTRGYIIYENNLPVRMIGSLTDISGIKKSETELVSERTNKQIEISETVLRVQEMERTRIGHDLHDNVNQILSCAKLFVDTLQPGDKKEKQSKNKSIEYISLAIEEIRKLSKELAAPQLKEEGLAENIRILIEDVHMTGPVRFEFIHDPEPASLSTDKKIALFRIVQEQVKNILKHSQAKTAGISISVKNRDIVLEIWDDGKGFTPGQTYQGIGLSNIRERVLIYNGNLNIDAAPGKGCRLTVTLPLL